MNKMRKEELKIRGFEENSKGRMADSNVPDSAPDNVSDRRRVEIIELRRIKDRKVYK